MAITAFNLDFYKLCSVIAHFCGCAKSIPIWLWPPAAEAILVSQPAISKMLKALEQLLDASLFDRGKQRVIYNHLVMDFA